MILISSIYVQLKLAVMNLVSASPRKGFYKKGKICTFNFFFDFKRNIFLVKFIIKIVILFNWIHEYNTFFSNKRRSLNSDLSVACKLPYLGKFALLISIILGLFFQHCLVHLFNLTLRVWVSLLAQTMNNDMAGLFAESHLNKHSTNNNEKQKSGKKCFCNII